MVRYIRQRSGSKTCAPIAVLNALKWAGYDCSYKGDFKDVAWKVGYRPRRGSNQLGLIRWAAPELQIIKHHTRPTLKTLDRAIDGNNSVVIDFVWCNGGGRHAALCIDRTRCYYTCVNFRARDKTVERVARSTMSKLLANVDSYDYPSRAWVIGRENE